MSASAYFKDAVDYHDWWFFSCTALGAMSPGETLKMLHEQLSEAGANAVIAFRFLDENDRGIDLKLWRMRLRLRESGLTGRADLTVRSKRSARSGSSRPCDRRPARPPSSPWPKRR